MDGDHYVYFPILGVPLCTVYSNERNLNTLHAPALAMYMYMQVHAIPGEWRALVPGGVFVNWWES